MSDLVMDFSDLAPVYLPVRGPDGLRYAVMKASAAAAARHRNITMRAGRWADGKVVGFEGMADCEPQLVADCLAVCDANGTVQFAENGQPKTCPLERVLGWPGEVIERIYEKVREISPTLRRKTDDEPEDKDGPKGRPSSTTTTST